MGVIKSDTLTIATALGEDLIKVNLDDMSKIWSQAIKKRLKIE